MPKETKNLELKQTKSEHWHLPKFPLPNSRQSMKLTRWSHSSFLRTLGTRAQPRRVHTRSVHGACPQQAHPKVWDFEHGSFFVGEMFVCACWISQLGVDNIFFSCGWKRLSPRPLNHPDPILRDGAGGPLTNSMKQVICREITCRVFVSIERLNATLAANVAFDLSDVWTSNFKTWFPNFRFAKTPTFYILIALSFLHIFDPYCHQLSLGTPS